ncbi:secretory carrier-associated membrane protein 2 [Takifugu rubripes]|uniref:Secretory carrier-associated membrane protein n=1 Tax=Takifugu rubripes TaxID=31033 RepID=H2UVV6_TAKRU|nr:secretory carrier-associated membrane protein 2 [Takifugu rubripes]XP_029698185.1 secretory carrier-associated membrane protein 2 [Takifugu rubripes]|eukprot:XP_003967297.1 PREDICTED: secretory carrier-associated membrane protein 2-like [Takifugu rubripes]
MSAIDDNPFAEPANENPFSDPSVTQVTSSSIEPVDQYNPFQTDGLATHSAATSSSPYQPAVLQPSTEPGPQATAAAAQANLLKQQEELERKAAALDRREQELQSRGASGKVNNWPPLPKNFPIKPCFYQDFSEEIPSEYQRVCKMMYYLWMLNCVTLFLNVLACLAFFIRDSSEGIDFGLSILWFILFTPCSFLCWYRPIYKAFKTDSSVSFFFFFFVFFCQVVIFIIQAVGIPSWGNSGWVTALSSLRTDKAVGAIMIIVAILFTFCASLSVVLLKMVHGLYRRTGASFHKAQQEFSQGVFTSKTFQTAASSAAQGALQRNN